MLLDQFKKGKEMKTEQLAGAVQVAWHQDTWDTPICARVYIVGTDDVFNIDENYDDIYDASREAFDKALEKTDMPADIKARAKALLGSKEYADFF